jgi:hypothetical protein
MATSMGESFWNRFKQSQKEQGLKPEQRGDKQVLLLFCSVLGHVSCGLPCTITHGPV